MSAVSFTLAAFVFGDVGQLLEPVAFVGYAVGDGHICDFLVGTIVLF
nr:hypothetical protein [uncultured Cohaesibacter sp.]